MSKHSVKTRLYACLAALALFALASGPATAQTYPSKVVKIIVPFPPGGLTDVLARAIGQELTKSWGQQVVVENRPGANTIIAAEVTAKSAPDGYTILMANDPTVSSNQYLYSKLPYDPVKDFAPVINIAETVEVLVASRRRWPN
jgi:tripartite-type tricarboxylate transporter receptor subunit TctC